MSEERVIIAETANEFKHVSVLRDESIEGLNIRPDGIYVDGTMGGAGHTRQVLKRLSDQGRVIGIDQDHVAIENAQRLFREENQEPRITLVHDNFSHIEKILQDLEIEKVDGFLLDLGVSSKQLDDGERGFSYQQDAPLDMRMDDRNQISAKEVVNTYSHDELRRILTEYGEEKWSSRIADFIVKEREKQPIETTFDLVRVIKQAIPKGARQDGPHPAKRSFQAIRVEVNQELTILEGTLEAMARHLNPGGRICVITFHSLEDRIIKQVFKKLENPCTCPPEFPVCVCGKKPLVKVITRKPILPSEEEIEVNPRSRSAKLRIAEGV